MTACVNVNLNLASCSCQSSGRKDVIMGENGFFFTLYVTFIMKQEFFALVTFLDVWIKMTGKVEHMMDRFLCLN